MSKKLLILFIAILALIGGVFFAIKKPPSLNETAEDDKIQVITTLYPLHDFVRNIGQDKVKATLLLPPGIEPHSFEPKPNDIVSINQGDVFVFTGKFMEVWAEDILKGVTNKDLKVVDASQGIKLILSHDPHIWLDFDNVQVMIDNIARGLAESSPANRDYFLLNAEAYKKSIRELDLKYKSDLSDCETREIIYGGHYAFGYLTKRYALQYFPAIRGFEPDSEPTANDIVEMVMQIKNNNIQYIFYEELSSPKVAETLVKETGTKMLFLNAAHNATRQDLDSGVSYLSIMEENLTNLKTGLMCQ